jgi:PncC family amidohydrolase
MAEATNRQLVEFCSEMRITLSTAESCTGGLLGSLITDVPGASKCYLGGIVAYSNRSKTELLGVKPGTIAGYGAVSSEVAIEMAQGCIERFGSTIAVSITGISGPSGGTEVKPVGTAYIAVAGGGLENDCQGLVLGPVDRGRFKISSTQKALSMLMGRANMVIHGGERNGPGLSA